MARVIERVIYVLFYHHPVSKKQKRTKQKLIETGRIGWIELMRHINDWNKMTPHSWSLTSPYFFINAKIYGKWKLIKPRSPEIKAHDSGWTEGIENYDFIQMWLQNIAQNVCVGLFFRAGERGLKQRRIRDRLFVAAQRKI